MKPSRILLVNILATGAFYVGSFVALGSDFPTINSSGQEVVDWFSAHGTNARIYAWTAAFTSLGLAIFAGQVAALLPQPHRYIFLAGVLGSALTAQVQAWIWAGLAFHPDLDPSAARTIFAIACFWGPLLNGSTTTMAVAFIPLGLGRAPIIPGWLTWLSIAFFVEQAIETITVFGQSGFIAPGGAMNVYLGERSDLPGWAEWSAGRCSNWMRLGNRQPSLPSKRRRRSSAILSVPASRNSLRDRNNPVYRHDHRTTPAQERCYVLRRGRLCAVRRSRLERGTRLG